MVNSLILNIPHSSSYIPAEDMAKAFLPHVGFSCYADMLNNKAKRSIISERNEAIQKELLVMTDWYTDELFDHSIGKAVIAPVSRLVCDTERFSHDNEEPMAARGMGFCYKKGSQNQDIKEFQNDYKDEVLWRYYAPHHIALTDAVASALMDSQKALVLDCHSFSSDPLPYEPIQASDRPEICIGTDDYHTPQALAEIVEKFFRTRGFKVGFNSPYAGTIVPLRYYGKDKRVQSIMIEINRGLYLKSGTSEKNNAFQRIQKTMFDLEMLLTIGNWN